MLLQWGTVPCEKRNGEVTGYIISRSGNEPEIVNGSEIFQYNMTDLSAGTTYTVCIQGVNEAGPGEIECLDATTKGMTYYYCC